MQHKLEINIENRKSKFVHRFLSVEKFTVLFKTQACCINHCVWLMCGIDVELNWWCNDVCFLFLFIFLSVFYDFMSLLHFMRNKVYIMHKHTVGIGKVDKMASNVSNAFQMLKTRLEKKLA